MKFYFRLQYLRLNRMLKEEGVHPFWVYGFVLLVFTVLSQLIVSWSDVGSWLYLAVATMIFTKWRGG